MEDELKRLGTMEPEEDEVVLAAAGFGFFGSLELSGAGFSSDKGGGSFDSTAMVDVSGAWLSLGFAAAPSPGLALTGGAGWLLSTAGAWLLDETFELVDVEFIEEEDEEETGDCAE